MLAVFLWGKGEGDERKGKEIHKKEEKRKEQT